MIPEDISIEQAKELIRNHNGKLNSGLSVLPSLEIYELDNDILIKIQVYLKKAFLYYDKSQAIPELRKALPKDIYRNDTEDLLSFPKNSQKILNELSNKLYLQPNQLNLDILSLKDVNHRIDKYFQVNPVGDDIILFELIVLVGEILNKNFNTVWWIDEAEPINNYLKIYVSNGKVKYNFFIKGLVDRVYNKQKLSLQNIIDFSKKYLFSYK